MYILIVIEYMMRIIVGVIKPFEIATTPPGAIFNIIMIPLGLIMFFFSILEPHKQKLE